MQQALLREDSFLFYTIHTVYYCFVIRVGVDICGKEKDTKLNYKFKKDKFCIRFLQRIFTKIVKNIEIIQTSGFF